MANIHLKLSTDQTVSHIWCSEVPEQDFAQDLILNGAIATDPQTFALPLSQTSALALRSLLTGKSVKLSQVDGAALSLIADRGRRGKTPNVFMTHDEKEVIVPARGAHLINEAHKINAYKVDSFFLIPAIKYRDFFNSLLTKDAEKLEHSPAIKDLFAGYGEKPEGMPEITYNPFQVTGTFEGYDGSLSSLREISITEYDYVIKDLEKESKKKAGTKKKPRDIVKSLNAMGIKTAFDMLHHFPLRYVDRSSPRPIKSLVKGEEASVLAKVVGNPSYDFVKRMSKITIQDFYGTKLSLVFFNQPWLPRQFKENDEVLVYGRYEPYVRKTDGMQFPSLSSPQINKIGDERSEVPIVPIYPQSEKSSINTWDILHLMKETFSKLDPEISDPLDVELREKYKLPSRYEAYKMLHFPENIKDVDESQRTLVYEELYRLQLFMLNQKKDFTLTPGISHKIISNGLVDMFLKKQPYSLTGAQDRAKTAIFEDMSKPHPMHRLLQGDVGSGKSTIASVAVLNTVESGHQAALMAPTEILAEQLYKGLAELAEDPEFISPRSGKPLNVVFLGTKLTAKNKKLTQEAIASGDVDIAVGTHALLSEHVSFPDLGMVVIDEQHRFGTAQRSHLRQARADGKTPDLLAMTATPIPRAAAMVLFGDLDITILDELPPGRIPIHTEWIEFSAQEAVETNQLRVWEHIRSEVNAGRQAYVVASLVEDNENLAAQSVDDAYNKLSDSVFPELRIGMVHGKLKKADKEAVMNSFSRGEIDILVSTTVIEVGVNVPNSTVMVVLDPGRFGIAQLHQIRGRVGRSNLPSTCYLLGETNTPEGRDRLGALVESTDGFYLAEKDLEIRKEGTLFGSKQSGDSDLYIARLHKHSDILAIAREDAIAVIEQDRISDAMNDEINAFYGGKEIAS
jgi:ATP-dependent DNA helicase RecG